MGTGGIAPVSPEADMTIPPTVPEREDCFPVAVAGQAAANRRETRPALGGAEGRDVPSFHPCPSDPACAYCGSSTPSGSDLFDWSFLDGAYCISLRSRPDRAARAVSEFHRVGLCRKVVFHRPTKHPTRPKIGIWEAHRAVALDALAKGFRAVLVFEDDVRFASHVRPRTVRAVRRALAMLPPDWTIFFLGHWPLRAWFVRRNVLRCASGCAHAYVASPSLLEWLREHPFGTAPFVRLAGTGIDAAYAALPGAYAFFPMLAAQSGIASDHLADGAERKLKKPEHLFSRWKHRELLLARLMRPNELVVAALSPLFYLMGRFGSPIRVHPPRSSRAVGAARVAPSSARPRAPGAGSRHRLAFLLDSLEAGGVQRMTLAIARCCRDRGHAVDLLVCRMEGPLSASIPDGVRLIGLAGGGPLLARTLPIRADPAALPALALAILLPPGAHWTQAHLRALARYLRRKRPDALLAGTPRLNLLAVWARRLAGTRTRVLVSERTAPTQNLARGDKWRKRALLPGLMRRGYGQADAVVAVSDGVADDLARLTGLPRAAIRTVHNPVVGPELDALSREPVHHPWLLPGEPPVVLSVVRLTEQKDLPTLLRAFALLRAGRAARLLILGDLPTPERTEARIAELRDLAYRLGVAADVELPGFVANPYAWMARARLFVLSSRYEGFANVLVEAMACGCPVVSTDCPSGPAEILDRGRYGPLVPVGDAAALAEAMARVLDAPPDPAVLRRRAGEFTVGRAADAYLEALFGQA